MPRQKLHRYARISVDPWVIKWIDNPHEIFVEEKNKYRRLILEIACGRWEYTVWLAQCFPENLFVGVDSKWDRIGVWLDKAHALGLHNVRFVCGIAHHLDRWFLPNTVDEIRIVHPDPRPKWRDEKRRLTYSRFLKMYHSILKSWWVVRLKTDDSELFAYSLAQFDLQKNERTLFEKTVDLWADEKLLVDHFGIKTHYEKLAIEEWRSICYAVWGKK